MAERKAKVEPGCFLPTVARHIRFIDGFTDDNRNEIRFATPDGREWHPISTYKGDKDSNIVWVDLVPVEYE